MRVQPKLPAWAVKTYTVSAPLETHWRVATCTEVQCPREEFGWQTVLLEADETGAWQANYIRTQSGRKYREYRREDGMTVFEFPAGQRCFAVMIRDGKVVAGHPKRIERPELFIVGDGDWRGNPRDTTPIVHSGPESWVDDFATHQDTLADAAKRG